MVPCQGISPAYKATPKWPGYVMSEHGACFKRLLLKGLQRVRRSLDSSRQKDTPVKSGANDSGRMGIVSPKAEDRLRSSLSFSGKSFRLLKTPSTLSDVGCLRYQDVRRISSEDCSQEIQSPLPYGTDHPCTDGQGF